MSITKSYNKYTGVYYAYETTYQWDEKQQRTIQRKRCIGHFDPVTNEVIQNGRRGRPIQSKPKFLPTDVTKVTNCKSDKATDKNQTDCNIVLESVKQILTKFDASLNALQSEIAEIEKQICSVLSKINLDK